MTRGSCLCGAVAWRADSQLSLMSHCHCSMCRKSHGSAFATYAAASADGFGWESGHEQVTRYESSPGFDRPFCSRCGSVVAGEPANGLVFMPVGCLDGDFAARPEAHIFVASGAPWHEIADDLPRFDAYPPGFPESGAGPRSVSAPSTGVIRGSCLCGGVGCELTDMPEEIVNCHCTRCRKARAAAHASNLFVAPSAFRWTHGEALLEHYKVPEAERFTQCFCRVCGSALPRVGASYVATPAGFLDDDPSAREKLHIHVASKAPWYEIADDLPQHAAGRDEQS